MPFGVWHPGLLPETLPVLLHYAVEKALEKNPAERYQSMRELVVDLRRAARQRTVGAAVAPAVKAAPARGNRWGWIAAALMPAVCRPRMVGWRRMARTPAGECREPAGQRAVHPRDGFRRRRD